jgi:HK97 gp10 family phage protein
MDEPVVHGMRELFQTMDAFPERLQRRSMVRVMRAGGNVVVIAARQRVRKRSGKLARTVRVVLKRRGEVWTARVIAGRNVKKDDAYYSLFLEKGTKPHEIRPAGKKSLFIAGLFAEVVHHPGAKAAPFLGPALEENVEQIVDAMQAELTLEVITSGWMT